MGWLDKIFRPNKDRFARDLMELLKAANPEMSIEYDAEDFRLQMSISSEDGGETGAQYSNLQNVYLEHCNTPKEQREEHLHRVARACLSYVKESPNEWNDAKCDVLPVLRFGFTLERIDLDNRLTSEETSPPIPQELVGDDLSLYLVYDLPESMRSISQNELDQWGVSFYQAREEAFQNLPGQDLAIAGSEGRLYFAGDNPYNPSWLLKPDFLDRLEVDGEHVAIVSNSTSFFITGSNDEEGLGMIASIAEKSFLEEPRPLSLAPIVHRDGRWESWLPPREHPMFETFEQFEIRSRHDAYATQKELLDAIHEKEGTDLFVASYTATQDEKTDILTNYCVWINGIDSLIPKGRNVLFLDSPDEPGDADSDEDPQPKIVAKADWETVEQVLGHLMERVEMSPPRYRVREFPTTAELEQLGQPSESQEE
jgi:uncharacterized protein YtpQ (UPF0354 family)